MNNLILNLDHYIEFEVLEENWEIFINKINKSFITLDYMIQSHNIYLNEIEKKIFRKERHMG